MSDQINQANISFVERVLVGVVITLLERIPYNFVAYLTADRNVDLMTKWDTMIPFVPQTVWIYVWGYFFMFLISGIGIHNRRLFYRCMMAVLLGSIIGGIFFFLIPSHFPRPKIPIGSGWTYAHIAWLYSFDSANNTFPSLHITFGFLFLLYLIRGKRSFYILYCAVLLCAVAVSTVTIKQHYLIDIPGGVVFAAFLFWLFEGKGIALVFRSFCLRLWDRLKIPKPLSIVANWIIER